MFKTLINSILIFLFSISIAYGADKSIKVVWDNNTEPDMKEYELVIIDNTDINNAVELVREIIPYTTTSNIVESSQILSLPDNQVTHIIAMVRAIDQSDNMSDWSAPATASIDFQPPAVPVGIIINIIREGESNGQ